MPFRHPPNARGPQPCHAPRATSSHRPTCSRWKPRSRRRASLPETFASPGVCSCASKTMAWRASAASRATARTGSCGRWWSSSTGAARALGRPSSPRSTSRRHAGHRPAAPAHHDRSTLLPAARLPSRRQGVGAAHHLGHGRVLLALPGERGLSRQVGGLTDHRCPIVPAVRAPLPGRLPRELGRRGRQHAAEQQLQEPVGARGSSAAPRTAPAAEPPAIGSASPVSIVASR